MTGRITRSSVKAAADLAAFPPPASPSKRPRPTSAPTTPKRPKAASSTAKGKTKAPDSPYIPPTPNTQRQIEQEAHQADEEGEKQGAVLLHPELRFKYADAKTHLAAVDSRWGVVMNKLACKPFEGENEPFNPFRTLVSSILGAQISWLAARAIQHKFVRLFFPHLPEKLPPPDASTPRLETPFPTPRQVLDLPDRTTSLRGAGLSGRKVEYIVELAERFTDGRLDAKELWGMEDDELVKTLVAIRGVGPWTADMFLIFASKRADVLPVGDLGIQKNLCRWFSHDPSIAPSIHPAKLAPASPTKLASSAAAVHPPPTPGRVPDGVEEEEEVASAATPQANGEDGGAGVEKLAALGSAEVELGQVVDLDSVGEDAEMAGGEEAGGIMEEEKVKGGDFVFPETSNGLTPGVLKARLSGKKLKGNIYLTPKEMEELTAAWRPYRSIACWYLWSLSEGTGDA
ncbi:hypothetical protein JCM3770_004471 [Rhodotorula araucariae]